MDPDIVVADPVIAPEVVDVSAPELPLPDVNPDILAAVDKALDPSEPVAEAEEEPETPVETPVESAPETPVVPVTEPEKVEDKRPSDEFGVLPENTKKETKERFETMRTKYDELHKANETTKAELSEQVERSERWADTIKSTGTNPEQFGLLMNYAKSVNSGTREGLEEAFAMMQNEMNSLAKALGKEAPGFDPLDQYPDLKTEFDDGAISRERALEIAGARAAGKLTSVVSQEKNEKQDYDQRRQNAMNGLLAVGNRIRANDPHHASKQQVLEVIVQTVLKSEADPEKWPEAIEVAYSKIPNPAPVVASPIISAVPTPIRPGTNSSGNVNKVAGSIMEAVEASLNYRR